MLEEMVFEDGEIAGDIEVQSYLYPIGEMNSYSGVISFESSNGGFIERKYKISPL